MRRNVEQSFYLFKNAIEIQDNASNWIKIILEFITNNKWPIFWLVFVTKFKNNIGSLIDRIISGEVGPGGLKFQTDQQKESGKPENLEKEFSYQLAKDLYDEKERNKLLNNLNDQVSGDRDTYLLAYHFEKTYRLIFGSQINILMGLEQKPVEISETINYYNTTSWKSRNYNFAQYIGFLLSSLLIKVNEKTSQYEITLIGRYFLNYMRSNNLQMQNKLPY